MFSLIPWKKKHIGGRINVWQDRPSEFYPMTRFGSGFNSLLDQFWDDGDMMPWGEQFERTFRDGFEDKPNEYVFQAELPGFEPEAIDVKVSGNSLSVRAEHKDEAKGQEGEAYRYGMYQRSFALPADVDGANIEASYHNGLLKVRLPKMEQAKGKRITVNAR